MNAMFAAIALFAAIDVGEKFAAREAWEETAVDFTADHAGEGFAFASQSRDIVNSLRRGSATWLGREVWETRIYYAPGAGASRVEMSLFNRGDRRPGDDFRMSSLQALRTEINRRCGGGAKLASPERTKLRSGGYRFRQTWAKCDPSVELAWGVGGERSDEFEYVRVTLTPRQMERPKGATKPTSGRALAAKAKANVRRNAAGDVWIDGVPMVDQGCKDYCAAAVAERVLRYYGFAVDEHEVAQQAGSRAEGGTNSGDMIATVRAIGAKNRLGFTQIVSMSGSLRDFEREVGRYNKAARSMREPEVSIADHTRGNVIMAEEIYGAMKPEVLRRMRTRDAGFKKFLAGVKAQTDAGVPICWAVTLGIFPEPGVSMQSRGGHVRLIVGYNARTREILYTDTWGAGHELKRMPEDWAFAITHEAFFLRPL